MANANYCLFSAVPTQYGSATINAWGGPGYRTVNMSAYDFQTYLPTPNHPGALLLSLLFIRNQLVDFFLKSSLKFVGEALWHISISFASGS